MILAKYTSVSLVMACLILASFSAVLGSAVKPIIHHVDGTKIVSQPADWNELRAKAYAVGRTKIAPTAFKSPLIIPARNCMSCLPGSPECSDMCEFAGEDFMACPNCRLCYNPNVADDVTRCTANNCRDRDGFNGCMLDINYRSLKRCIEMRAPNLVMLCAAGVLPTVGLGSYIYCFLSKCM